MFRPGTKSQMIYEFIINHPNISNWEIFDKMFDLNRKCSYYLIHSVKKEMVRRGKIQKQGRSFRNPVVTKTSVIIDILNQHPLIHLDQVMEKMIDLDKKCSKQLIYAVHRRWNKKQNLGLQSTNKPELITPKKNSALVNIAGSGEKPIWMIQEDNQEPQIQEHYVVPQQPQADSDLLAQLISVKEFTKKIGGSARVKYLLEILDRLEK